MHDDDLSTVARAMRSFTMSANHHVGGSLSPAEFLTVLYFAGDFRLDATARLRPDRDKYVHSKGHAAAAHYFALWLHGWLGNVPLEELLTFGDVCHRLPRIPQRNLARGVEMTTGALGQGLSYANGLALADRRSESGAQTVVLLGDAELSEGQIWESAQTTIRLGLRNVTVVIDANGFGSHMITARDSIASWWRGFGWDVHEIDGHDISGIRTALRHSRDSDAATALVLRTRKGNGLLPPYCESPNAGGEVPAEYRPSYELGDDVDAAVAVVERTYPAARQARAEPLGDNFSAGFDPTPLDFSPQRDKISESIVTKRFAEEFPELVGPDSNLLIVSPDAIRNSGLMPMLRAYETWSWENRSSPVLEHQIAEQDVVSLAAGATSSGLRSVVFLMEGFAWRMLDSLRQSVCFPRLPVVIVSTSAGLGDELGPMVQSDSCFAAVSTMPNLLVLEASDINEAKVLFNTALATDGPVYLRLPHEAITVLGDLREVAAREQNTGAWVMADARPPDLVLVTAGSMVGQALAAAGQLATEDSVRTRVLNVFSVTRLRQLPEAERNALLGDGAPQVSVHNGPPSVLREFLGPRSVSLGVAGYGMYGKPVSRLYEACGLSVPDIVAACRKFVSDS